MCVEFKTNPRIPLELFENILAPYNLLLNETCN